MSDLIEAMARAICVERDHEEYEDIVTTSYDRDLATAAYNALRETLVPVGWEYWPSAETDELPFMQPNRANMDPRYWTETPLFALPEIDNG